MEGHQPGNGPVRRFGRRRCRHSGRQPLFRLPGDLFTIGADTTLIFSYYVEAKTRLHLQIGSKPSNNFNKSIQNVVAKQWKTEIVPLRKLQPNTGTHNRTIRLKPGDIVTSMQFYAGAPTDRIQLYIDNVFVYEGIPAFLKGIGGATDAGHAGGHGAGARGAGGAANASHDIARRALLLADLAGLLSDNSAAEQLLEYLLSPDAQSYFSKETYEYPVVEGIEASVDLIPLDKMPTLDVRFAEVSAALEATLVAISTSGLLP